MGYGGPDGNDRIAARGARPKVGDEDVGVVWKHVLVKYGCGDDIEDERKTD